MINWITQLSAVDPSLFFAGSLLPYLLFLHWLGQCKSVHRFTQLGFRLTLLFVAVTIAAAIIALRYFDAELVAVDPLHGGAEAFLTLSNALIVAGLMQRLNQHGSQGAGE
ncbi:DUF3593 domain-containing protein [Synechococcus sp. MIT S9451]|jgi:hypothetical protein|uniref:DUF3593 domain-containing protein n=1 Tax=Synechococcus sp. MIT S9451 TaxID=3082543 RepID=UPI0039B4CC3F